MERIKINYPEDPDGDMQDQEFDLVATSILQREWLPQSMRGLPFIRLHQTIESGSIPRIDFSRSTTKKPKSITIEGGKTNSSGEASAKLLIGTQYQRISAILGLELIPDRYDVIISPLPEGIGAKHIELDAKHYRGRIRLSRSVIQTYIDYYEYPRESDPTRLVESTLKFSGALSEIVKDLAHELYHKRQAIFFPKSFSRRCDKKRYISSLNDSVGYQEQLIEVGARLFADKYLYFLTEAEKDSGELLGNTLKFQRDMLEIYHRNLQASEERKHL